MKKNEKTKREDLETKQARAEVEENCPNAIRKENFDSLMQAVFGEHYTVEKKARILVAGPTSYSDYRAFSEFMDNVFRKRGITYKEAEIVAGHAQGVDELSERYAGEHHLCLTVFPLLREKYGKDAGAVRQKQVLSYIGKAEKPLVVAFCDGKTPEPDLMLLAACARGYTVEPFEIQDVRAASMSAEPRLIA